MKEQNDNIYELINDELNSIIENYIMIKGVIYTLETIEKVISIIQKEVKKDERR